MKNTFRVLLAVLSGLLLSMSWPARGFAPLIFIAFVPLYILDDDLCNSTTRHGGRKAFWFAALAFFIWNVLDTFWIWNAAPAAAVGLLLNTLFMSTTFWLFHITKKHLFINAKKGNFLLIFFWLSFELLNQHWDLNWPWLNLGNVLASMHQYVQWYEFTGVAGGSLWIFIVNLLVYYILNLLVAKASKKITITSSLLLCLVILVPCLGSKIMYNNNTETGEAVEIIVVQPNVDPWGKGNPYVAKEIIETAKSPLLTEKTKFIVAPESALTDYIRLETPEQSYSINLLQNFTQEHPQVAVVTGGNAISNVEQGHENDFAAQKYSNSENFYYLHNSAILVDSSTKVQFHHKSRLTPGVEMMPSWFFLRPLKGLVEKLGGFFGTLKTESISQILHFEKFNVATLICYESDFGSFVAEYAKKSNIIFIITNDGWWGNTPGYRQHFETARLRAIETRRSIARSANTGISGFFNQRGDVLQQTEYWVADARKETLKTNDKITFYMSHGDYLNVIAVVLAGLALVAFFFVTPIRNKKH